MVILHNILVFTPLCSKIIVTLKKSHMRNKELEEVLNEFGIKHDVPVEDLLPVLFIIRAYRKGIKLEFESTGMHYQRGIDSELDELYDEATRKNSKRDYNFSDMSRVYSDICEYPYFFENNKYFPIDLLDACDPPLSGSQNPPLALVDLMSYTAGIQTDNLRVYNPFGPAPSFPIFSYQRGKHSGLIQTTSYTLSLFLREVFDSIGIEKVKVEVSDSSKEWSKEEFDAVISVMPDMSQLGSNIYHFIKNVAARSNGQKKSVVIVPEPFIWCSVFKGLREDLCKSGYLSKVVYLPVNYSYSPYLKLFGGIIWAEQHAYMIVLDHESTHDAVDFVDLSFLSDNSYSIPVDENLYENIPQDMVNTVPISEIEKYDYSLSQLMYIQHTSSDPEYEMVPLSELVDIVKASSEEDFIHYPDQSGNIPVVQPIMSKNVVEACTKSMKRLDGEELGRGYGRILVGPHIHYNGLAFSNKEDISYIVHPHLEQTAFTLKDERVTQDYLTYVLIEDKLLESKYKQYCRFQQAYENIELAPPITLLLSHKVVILKDKNQQNNLLTEAINEAARMGSLEAEYNVVWIDANADGISQEYKEELEQWKINVVKTFKVADDITADDIVGDAFQTADAVIVDAGISMSDKESAENEEYEGLDKIIELKDSISEKNIPFYIFSSVGSDVIKPFFRRRRLAYFTEQNRFFLQGKNGQLKLLISQMRKELDDIGSIQSKINNKFKRELESIPEYKKEEFIDVLSQCMYEEFSYSSGNIDTENKFNALRKIVEEIFRDCADLKILPDTDLGGQIQFLSDGAYVDSRRKRAYFSKYDGPGIFMHRTLRYSLVFLKDILNGGSHIDDEQGLDVCNYVRTYRTSNLYKSAAYIVFDLLIWYNGMRKVYKENKKTIFFEAIDTLPLKQQIYEVQSDGDYWYCDRFHLKNRRELKVGLKVKIKEFSIEKRPRLNGVDLFSEDYVII